MKLIVAVDERWGIGKNGDLLLSIPDDMRFFREMTRSAVLVMGYNTLISFPGSKPLPGRLNIVLNDAEGCRAEGAVICRSLDQLFRFLNSFGSDEVYVIGGGSIYRQLLPYCDTAYITKMRFDGGADTFIPDLDRDASWTVAEQGERREYEGIVYSFLTYHNASPTPIAFAGAPTGIAECFKKREDGTKPLPQGFTAEDVDAYLDSGYTDFAAYLSAQKLI